MTTDTTSKALDVSLKEDISNLIISATFTIDPILPSLNYLLDFAGLKIKADVAPYNQVFQQLLDGSSQLSKNTNGIQLIVIRLEDFIRDYNGEADNISHLEKITVELEDALAQFAKRISTPILFALLPSSVKVDQTLKAKLATISDNFLANIQAIPGLYHITPDDLATAACHLDSGYDALSDNLGHIPYNETTFAAFALAIARKIHAIRVTAKKVLVLDCDNTIWQGVVGEDGVDGIVFTEASLRIQQFAVDIQSQGILICLASKNAEADVIEVFEKRNDTVLKLPHIISHRINWEPKYRNLQSLADELNLGLDAFVFFDDNPVECEQMKAEQPGVVTIQIPSDEQQVKTLLDNLWAFDKLTVTDEDAKRTQMYRENRDRQTQEDSATDIVDFIASLELVIDIGLPEEEEWPRVSQLTQRTNQFNFTTVRRSEPEIRALAASGECFVHRIKVSDRFGDYGLVGLTLSKVTGDALTVDILLLSCRVLGRGVEHAMLRNLGELALSLGLKYVDLPYIFTAKNEPALAFANHVASAYKIEQDGLVVFKIPTEFASQITHQPGHDPEAVIEAKRADGKKKPASTVKSVAGVSFSQRYEKLSKVLVNGDQVLAQVRETVVRDREVDTPIVPAETKIEQELLALWQSILGIKHLGVEDDFFALGGTSLLVVSLFTEIERRYKVRLRLTAILEASTIRSLALLVQPNRAAGSNILIELKSGSPNNLFLVHDGDGETLLYKNLAERFPQDFAVYGIEPRSLPGNPMAHSSLDEMAAYYIEAIRQKQPHGPYYLSGMCAGGLIAYIMAEQLVNLGETVGMVAILDAATPNAAKQTDVEKSLKRVSGLLNASDQSQSTLLRYWFIATQLGKKAFNFIRWHVSSNFNKLSVSLRFSLLKNILQQNKAWPSYLPELTVRSIFVSAEFACQLKSNKNLKVLLVRATAGEGDDLAYRYLYLEETFGWRQFAPQLEIVDVAGGHSSMLQNEYVDSLANALVNYISKG